MNKRRILLSAIIGAIALTGLSVSLTLAWYAASDRLGIRSLEVSVASAVDLKISTSPEIDTFKSAIDLTPTDEEFVFLPVSSLGRTNWQDKNVPEFFDCSYSYVSSNGVPEVEKMSYGFFQQKIYLLTNLDYYVTLDVNPSGEARENPFSTFTYNDSDNLARANRLHKQLQKDNPEFNMEVSEIKEKLDSLVNCLRVSILVTEEDHYNYYIVDPTKQRTDVTVFGGRLDNDRDGYYDTYEDENGDRREIVYGEVSETSDRSKIVYSDPIDTSAVEEEKPVVESFFWNSFEAESSKKAFTYDEMGSKTNGFALKEEKAYSLEELDSERTELRIPCYANKPAEIVVSIYLEGWDLDCINSTMGASFKTNLVFKLLGGIID